MKRLPVIGLACFAAAAFSGCGSLSQHSDSDYQTRQLHQQHRQQTDQTVRQIESRVSNIPESR